MKGQWVFGGHEKYNKNKIFMIPVHNRKAKTLLPIIKKYILLGSIIHSDCWKAYDKLGKIDYIHVTATTPRNLSIKRVQPAPIPLKVI